MVGQSEYSEHELEVQWANNGRAFLLEMGGDFTFIGNQEKHGLLFKHPLQIVLNNRTNTL